MQRIDITEKIDFVTNISQARALDGEVQKPPQSVKIELTNRCNLRCKFCAVRTRLNTGSSDMDLDFFKKIVWDMRMCNVREIGLFFLGESFTAPDLLVAACRYCKDIGIPYVFLTSNAVAAYPEVVEELFKAGLDSLKWSVNCASLEQFKEITGGGEKQFENAFKNIGMAWGIRNNGKYDTTISASSILYAGEQKQKMDALLNEKVRPFVDKHYWLPLYQMAMYREKLERELGYTPTAGNMGRIDEKTMMPTRKPLPCWTAFTEGHVRVDGSLSACCFGSDEKFDMGKLDGTNFMHCWNSMKFRALRCAQLRTEKEGQKSLCGTPCEVCVAYK